MLTSRLDAKFPIFRLFFWNIVVWLKLSQTYIPPHMLAMTSNVTIDLKADLDLASTCPDVSISRSRVCLIHSHVRNDRLRVWFLSCFLRLESRSWTCTYMPNGEEDKRRREQQSEHITKGRECERHGFCCFCRGMMQAAAAGLLLLSSCHCWTRAAPRDCADAIWRT